MSLKGQVIPPPIYEQNWKFSEASDTQVWIALGLGLFNLLEVFIVGNLLSGYTEEELKLLGSFVINVVNFTYSALYLYGLGYLFLPLVRYCYIHFWKNQKIERRNKDRRESAIVLLNDLFKQEQTLMFAKHTASKGHDISTMTLGERDIVLTTGSQYPELELQSFRQHNIIS